MVLFDTNYLSFLFTDNTGPIVDPSTDIPVEQVKEKIDHLFSTLCKGKAKIVIPTPVLAELLVVCTEGQAQAFNQLAADPNFSIASFDMKAAVEAARFSIAAREKGDKKGGSKKPWEWVKIDRQIIAIAKVMGVGAIYSSDEHIIKFAAECGMQVIPVWDLPSPPPHQEELALEAEEEAEEEMEAEAREEAEESAPDTLE